MNIKYIATLTLGLAAVSCTSTTSDKPAATQSGTGGKVVTPVSHMKNGMNEVMKLTSTGHEVIVSLDWRNYSGAEDSSVSKWYGDMGRPPAKYVAESLTVSIDGKGVVIPKSKYRYLASQWMNEVKSLGVYTSGKNLNIYVNLGDGAEAWAASYVINPASGALVSHKMYDGAEFHNLFAP